VRRLGFLFLSVVLSSAHAQGKPRVTETFEVGPNVYVRALAVEPARNALWVGTSTGMHEVDLASGRLRATFTRRDGLASEQVYALAVDPQGYKWIGTGAGGASRYRQEKGTGGGWKTYFPMHGLADYRVFAFAFEPRGAVWMGTLAGASRLDRQSGRFSTRAKELVNDWVHAVAVDEKGRVWFGTEGGVSMYDGRQWRAWTEADGLGAAQAVGSGEGEARKSYVFALHAARDGSLWAGTWGGGAARFDGERWRSVTTKDGLAGNIVYSIAQDPEGALWFGTDAGISRYESGKFVNLGAKEGLAQPNVYALAVAPGNQLWAGTKGSVARILRR
jgi:ligand-binding sensor domain-containing protein